MSITAWYPLPPQSGGGTPSAGNEFFDNDQTTSGWPLWSWCLGSPADDDHGNHGGAARVEMHGNGNGNAAGSSVEHTDGHAPVPPPPQQQRTQATDDIFMSQFSDEEMRRMDDAPFEALDMFPGSMHRLLSYENMLSGVLTGSSSEEDDHQQQQQQDAGLGVDTMDTCGFPLFSHDLMPDAPSTELVLPDLGTPNKDRHQDVASSVTKRSRSSVAGEESFFLEALVLQELEDVVFQKLTKRTRVCFRDAFFRLAAESSRAKCSAAHGHGTPSSESGGRQAAEGNASSRMSAPGPGPGCPERETNAIDRTVADLTMKQPHPVPLEVPVSRCAADDDRAAEAAQSGTTSATWTMTA